MRRRHDIRLAPEAATELRSLPAHVRARIMNAIERHLRTEPAKVGGKKKLLVLDDGRAIWQLRIGDYRVFFEVDIDEPLVVLKQVRKKGRKTTGEIR